MIQRSTSIAPKGRDTRGFHKVPAEEPQTKTTSSRERCRRMAAWNWFFDIATVVISFANFAVGVWVTSQLDFEEIWKSSSWTNWLCIFGICKEFTAFGVEKTIRKKLNITTFGALQYIILFPFCGLVPPVDLLLHRFYPARQKRDNSDYYDATELVPRTLLEECNAMSADLAIMEWVRDQGEYDTDCLTGCAPTFIYCMALFISPFIGNPIALLTLAMASCATLFLTWAHRYCVGINGKAMAFSLLLVVFDFLNGFYTAVELVSGVGRDYFTLRLRLVVTGVAVLLSAAVFKVVEHVHGKWRRMLALFGVVTFVALAATLSLEYAGLLFHLLGFFPHSLILGWSYYLLNSISLPREPAVLLIHSFINRGNRDERLRFIFSKEGIAHEDIPFGFWKFVLIGRKQVSALAVELLSFSDDAISMTPPIAAAVLWVLPWQLYAFVFPFTDYASNDQSQNVFLRGSIKLLGFVLLSILCLLPSAYEYICFCIQMQYFDRLPSLANTKRWIAEYHAPQSVIAMDAVPSSVMPPDVVGEVAEFLPSGSLNLDHLTICECQEIKDRQHRGCQ